MYKPGDDKLEVRELLVKAFASAWEAGEKAVDRDTYINSSINVIDSLQVGPEMISTICRTCCAPTAHGSTTLCLLRTILS